MKLRIAWSIVCCSLILVLLAACAPAPPAAPATPAKPAPVAPASPAPTSQPTAPVKPVATAVNEPVYGGTINFNTPVFEYFDVYRFESYSLKVTSLWSEKIGVGDWAVDRKAWDYPSLTGETPLEYMRGQLIEKWEIPDPLTMVWHLRKGVRFHNKPPVNGREFTINDFMWNYDRIRTSPFQEHQWHDLIASVTKVDNYTIQIKLKFATNFSTPGVIDGKKDFFIAPEAVPKGASEFTDWQMAIGTGPFMLTDYVAGSALTFKKNPDYWAYDETHPNNRLPYADTVKVLLIPDPSTQQAALRTGKADLPGFENPLAVEDAKQLMSTNSNLKSRRISAYSPGDFRMRIDRKPFDDVRVRQAMNMAIDREEIVKSLYAGFAYPYFGMLHVTDPPFFTPYDKLPDKPIFTTVSIKDILSYNPQKAKQLLAEAGYPNGFKTIVDTTLAKDVYGLTPVLQSYLSKIGVQAEIKTFESGVYDAMRRGKRHDEILYSWISLNINPLNSFLFFTSPTHQNNHVMVDDPVYNAKVDEAQRTSDPAKLLERVRWLDYYTLENAWFINFPHNEGMTVWQPWLKAYAGEGCLGNYEMGSLFARLWIDQKLKKSLGF